MNMVLRKWQKGVGPLKMETTDSCILFEDLYEDDWWQTYTTTDDIAYKKDLLYEY